MKLKNYIGELGNLLEGIRTGKASLEDVSSLFGVAEGFAVLMDADFSKIGSDFQEFSGYEGTFLDRKGEGFMFQYPGRGRTILRISEDITRDICFGNKEDHEKQMKDYNIGLVFYISWSLDVKARKKQLKDLANRVKSIGDYILAENIPCCFPFSAGWNDMSNYSRIVYFPDSVDEEMLRLKKLA